VEGEDTGLGREYDGTMNSPTRSYFDQAAATWDDNPRRIAQVKAIGEAMLREANLTKALDVLDYGCGTGLLGLFLLPHVRSVTGADSSEGMLAVLRSKVGPGVPIKVMRLDLEHDPVPEERYDLIVNSMVLHHATNIDKLLNAFHHLLRPGGALCIADLDTEPGLFHDERAAASVHHLGFDRAALRSQLIAAGFRTVNDVMAHVIRKPGRDGKERDFPVFVMTATR